MSRYEKIALLLVVLALISLAGNVAVQVYGAEAASSADKVWLVQLATLLGSLVHVGAAVWLGVEASAAGMRSWVWALFGLVFGLMAVALFYLIQLYTALCVRKT